MLVAHSMKGLLTKDDVKRMRSVYKKYVGGGGLSKLSAYTDIEPNVDLRNFDPMSGKQSIANTIGRNNAIASQQNGSYSDSPDWKGTINGTMPYLSNILNSFRKLPAPQAPSMEQTIDPNLVNYDPQRTELRRLQSNTNAGLDYRVSNPVVRQALKGQTLAHVISGSNQIAGEEFNTNAGIKNQNAQANSLINARNTERTNTFKDNLLSRSINQQRLNSENTANFSDKYQMNVRDEALMELENRKLNILPKMYENGTFDRNLTQEQLKEKYKLKKLGGKVKPIINYI